MNISPVPVSQQECEKTITIMLSFIATCLSYSKHLARCRYIDLIRLSFTAGEIELHDLSLPSTFLIRHHSPFSRYERHHPARCKHGERLPHKSMDGAPLHDDYSLKRRDQIPRLRMLSLYSLKALLCCSYRDPGRETKARQCPAVVGY